MAQKVNPIAVRLGFNRNSDSSWFSDYYYATLFYQDYHVRNYLNCIKQPSGTKLGFRLAKCIIHHYPKKSCIHLFCLGSKRQIQDIYKQVDTPKYSYDNIIPFVVEQEKPNRGSSDRVLPLPRVYKKNKHFDNFKAKLSFFESHFLSNKQKDAKTLQENKGGVPTVHLGLTAGGVGGVLSNPKGSSDRRLVQLLSTEEPRAADVSPLCFSQKTSPLSRRAFFDTQKRHWITLQQKGSSFDHNKQSKKLFLSNLTKQTFDLSSEIVAHLFWLSDWTNIACKQLIKTNLMVAPQNEGSKTGWSEGAELPSSLGRSVLRAEGTPPIVGSSGVFVDSRCLSKEKHSDRKHRALGQELAKQKHFTLLSPTSHKEIGLSSAFAEFIPLLASSSEFGNVSFNYFVMHYFLKRKMNKYLALGSQFYLEKSPTDAPLSIKNCRLGASSKGFSNGVFYLTALAGVDSRLGALAGEQTSPGRRRAISGDQSSSPRPLCSANPEERDLSGNDSGLVPSTLNSPNPHVPRPGDDSHPALVNRPSDPQLGPAERPKALAAQSVLSDQPQNTRRRQNSTTLLCNNIVASNDEHKFKNYVTHRKRSHFLSLCGGLDNLSFKANCLQLCVVKSRHYYLSNLQTVLWNQTNTLTSIIPIQVTSIYQSASLVAQEICFQLEQTKSFRQICKTIFQEIEQLNYIKGIRIACSGRLNGAEIAKTECKKYGETSLHVFSDQIDYAYMKASTPYGILGVKVWISYLQKLD